MEAGLRGKPGGTGFEQQMGGTGPIIYCLYKVWKKLDEFIYCYGFLHHNFYLTGNTNATERNVFLL